MIIPSKPAVPLWPALVDFLRPIIDSINPISDINRKPKTMPTIASTFPGSLAEVGIGAGLMAEGSAVVKRGGVVSSPAVGFEFSGYIATPTLIRFRTTTTVYHSHQPLTA